MSSYLDTIEVYIKNILKNTSVTIFIIVVYNVSLRTKQRKLKILTHILGGYYG